MDLGRCHILLWAVGQLGWGSVIHLYSPKTLFDCSKIHVYSSQQAESSCTTRRFLGKQMQLGLVYLSDCVRGEILVHFYFSYFFQKSFQYLVETFELICLPAGRVGSAERRQQLLSVAKTNPPRTTKFFVAVVFLTSPRKWKMSPII